MLSTKWVISHNKRKSYWTIFWKWCTKGY